MRLVIAVILSIPLLSGCADDSGSTLSCPTPDATECNSLNEVYEKTNSAGKASIQRQHIFRKVREINTSIEPDLSKPETIRVWVAPWQDEQGDLHDQQFLYLVIQPPKWNVDYLDLATEAKP